MIYGDRLPADCVSTVINDLYPGLDYKINLIALTEHPVGKKSQDGELDESSAYDSTYNSDDGDVSVESYDDGAVSSRQNPVKMKHAFTKSADSGRRTQSSVSDGDEIMNFMSTVKTMRNTTKHLEEYASCKPGLTLYVNYNNLVVPPDHVDVIEVLGQSVQLAWNFSVPKNIRNSSGLILIRPEIFSVLYWKRGETMETAKSKETKGKSLCFTFFKTFLSIIFILLLHISLLCIFMHSTCNLY